MKKIRRIGIAGCGNIGSEIAGAIIKDFAPVARLSALYDIDPLKARGLSEKLGKKNLTAPSLKDLIAKSDLVIECASAQASAGIARQAIKSGRDCMLMSVGGLLEEEKILELARKAGVRLYIPSGAVCGIDGLKADSLA
ncbi:MAG TPA: Gfo/Idh/MocA family oxidoreductase, partial [Candidatus Omnitrophota bacterium]|nr:Gfo/Idh/MocA family oxidoreductase [Candidatus Omnitrophota bacterium]